MLHFDVATFPMQFISMDLIGEFHPPTTKGKRYALTVICMLTGYVFCIPLKTKTAEEDHIPDLHWKLANSYHTTEIGQTEVTNVSIHNISIKTLTGTCNLDLSTETCTTKSRCEPLCSLQPIT